MQLLLQLKKIFDVDEIENSKTLKTTYWTLLIGFFLSFDNWITKSHITVGFHGIAEHVCPPYFQNCSQYYFLSGKPNSYDQYILFTIFTLCILFSIFFAIKNLWQWALLFLIPPFVFKVIYIVFLSYLPIVDFEYFHLPLLFVFIFCKNKIYFLKRAWVLNYLFAATMKFNSSWIVGSYFSAINIGLPLFSKEYIPLITNLVITFEIISPWFLLSSDRKTRHFSLFLWLIFHLYSVILVGFMYPLYCIPVLVSLFFPDFTEVENQLLIRKKYLLGWALLYSLILINLFPFFIPGNKLYTLQDLRFGVRMFDANHQYVSKEKIIYQDGKETNYIKSSNEAMRRANPYNNWYNLKSICRTQNIKSIQWEYLSSVNGGPFYQIAKLDNLCQTKYRAFKNNEWLLTPDTNAPIVGYPDYSVPERLQLTEKNIVFNKPIVFLSPLQEKIQRNLNNFQIIYWILFCVTFLIFISKRLFLKKLNLITKTY